jgi:prophage regulatory protein
MAINIEKLIRAKELCQLLSINKSTLWRWRQTQNFPKPIVLGANTVAWKLSTIDAWIKERSDEI